MRQAKELAAANMTPEAVAARMDPAERKKLSMVRNIGIAVCQVPGRTQKWAKSWVLKEAR
jgi:elongation factor G